MSARVARAGAPFPLSLEARTVAVVGATPDENKLGGKPIKFMRDYGFAGRVYPVNPKYAEIGGWPCHPTIEAIDDAIDLAVVAVPERGVADVVRACVAKGVRQVIVFASGYAETGEVGAAREAELAAVVAEGPTRLIGPNTLGFANLGAGLVPSFSQGFELGPGVIHPGPVAFASQSGAFGTFIFTLAAEQGVGLRHYAVTGNEIDVTLTDFLRAMLEDAGVSVALAYVEGLRDGRAFLETAEAARRAGKSVVVVKTGRTPGGSAAAMSHTAALAGADEVYDAAFRQTGVLRVRDEEEMLDLLNMMRAPTPVAGRRVAVLTMSGGAGVLIADALDAHGLALAALAPGTTERLKGIVPAFGSVRNPVDLTGQFLAEPGMLQAALETLLADPETDAVLLFLGLGRRHGASIGAAIAAAAAGAPKPLAVAWVAGPAGEIAALRAKGVPVFDAPTRSVRAIAGAARLAEARAAAPRSFDLPVATARLGGGARLLTEREAKAALVAAGVAAPPERLCRTPEEAARAAAAIGFPVVMKISAPALLHKTEAGGVALGVADEAAARDAFGALRRAVLAHDPSLEIEGVLVAATAPPGVELIVGVRRDPAFGPYAMVGAGGLYAEALRDTAVRVLPLAPGEAEAMLRELRVFPMLDGARGRPKADVAAAARAVEAAAALLLGHADVEEIEINPLRVFEAGRGAWALDAVLRTGPAEETAP